ncbi:MAG: hypothetical protein V1688_00395 [bacterium]
MNNQEKSKKILSDSILYGLSKFWVRPKETNEFIKKIGDKVHQEYNNNSSLFEIGCYLYFRIDLWHCKTNIGLVNFFDVDLADLMQK